MTDPERALRVRRVELERTIREYVFGPRPSGEMAMDAFAWEIDGMEREIDEIDAKLAALARAEGEPQPRPQHNKTWDILRDDDLVTCHICGREGLVPGGTHACGGGGLVVVPAGTAQEYHHCDVCERKTPHRFRLVCQHHRSGYDMPIDDLLGAARVFPQQATFEKASDYAARVREWLADIAVSAPDASPEGPWRVEREQDSISTPPYWFVLKGLGNECEACGRGSPFDKSAGVFDTEREAIAVRDALNRVAAERKEGP